MRILAISGSLRATSSNSALLRMAAAVAPPGIEITQYDGLARLPHFNPDDDLGVPPEPVLELRAHVGASDALLFCVPEYAHGMPGSLKNALDWLVSSVELPGKRVALLNASPMATHAQAALTETLTLMTAVIVREASVTIPVTRADIDANGAIGSAEIRGAVQEAVGELRKAVLGRGR